MAPDDRGAADPVPADATNRMKFCPNCQTQYPDDANFCPQEGCATGQGPRRLEPLQAASASAAAAALPAEAQLGGSRSGEVFRARDSQTGQTVAYKLVAQASLPTTATLERAQRELKQLQRAQSPRLARVLDFGKDADGRLFIASELCDGQPLDQLVANTGPLPLDRAKAIVAQIGEALLEGQKVGVVHHDLSPKNVLVSGSDEVKVINFVAPVAVSETVFGVRRVPVAGAGGGEAGRPALEHVQPGRHPDAAADGPAARVGRRYRRHPGPGDEGRAGSPQPSRRRQHRR